MAWTQGWAGRAALCACVAVAGAPFGAVAQGQNAHIVTTEPLTAEAQQKTFHLPPGFEIQLVAAEPDIQKPINLKFDAQGRLWVTDTIEYPYAVAPGKKGRDSVKIITLDSETGKARKVKTFTSGLSIPIGICPLEKGAIVFSIPNLIHAPDANGDDEADSLEPLIGPFDQRDTHGLNNALTRWVDGRIYACHGFSNQSNPKGKDGRSVVMHSGNTYRFQPDGTELTHWTWGQVNPFGNCFDAYGHLFTADCHSQPAYQLIRGAYYPSFGKPHDGLGFGPTMVTHSHGSTGIAGIVHYTADQFPPEYRDRIFIGNPITHKINQDEVKRSGGSISGKELGDFLTCDDLWHRPVDVQLGPDGALYVADFYNCIIGHYEVPLDHAKRDRHRGRIWRIVYRGVKGEKVAPATIVNCRTADLEGLVKLSGHANLTVRTQATHEIVDRIGKPAQERLTALLASPEKAGLSDVQTAHLLWAAERLGGASHDALRQALGSASPLVRTHALAVLRERPDAGAKPEWIAAITTALKDPDGYVARAAADAVVVHPSAADWSEVAAAWEATPGEDPQKAHTLKIALRNQLARPDALKQVARETLPPARQARVAEILLAIPSAESAYWLEAWLPHAGPYFGGVERFVRHSARWLPQDKTSDLLKTLLYWKEQERDKLSPGAQAALLRAWQSAGQERGAERSVWLAPTTAWAEAVAEKLLRSTHEGEVKQGLELARDYRSKGTFDATARLGRPGAPFGALRADALAACVAQDGGKSIPVLCEVAADAREAVPLRQRCVQMLAGINDPKSREELLGLLKIVPESVAVEIASGLASSKEGAETLLAAAEAGKAPAALLTESAVLQRLQGSKLPEWEARRKKLTAGLPARDDRVRKILVERREKFPKAAVDVASGKAVFAKHCVACHKLEGQGNKIGPELEGIGQRGLDRVLEDVLDPSRNVDHAFRSTLVQTTDGRVVTGLLLRQEGEVLILADAQGKEVRIPADEVENRSTSPLSPMPGNVVDLVPEAEFFNLVAYLLSQAKK